MNQFPTEENFHGYLWWILREIGDFDAARNEFQKGIDINDTNPFLNYNIGILEKETWNNGTALIYLKKVLRESPDSEFGKLAEAEIELLKK